MLDRKPSEKLGETRGGVEGLQILAARRPDHRINQKSGRGGRQGGRKTLAEKTTNPSPENRKKKTPEAADRERAS
jgi:hypothetical protein